MRVAHGGKSHCGWVEVSTEPHRNALRVQVSATLAKVVPAVLGRVKHLFDLSCHPLEVSEALGALATERPGLRVPGAADGFEVAVRAVLGQQVSVAAARTLAGRFAAAFGIPVSTPFTALTHAFPNASEVAKLSAEEIAALGLPLARARTISELAKAVDSGMLRLSPGADPAGNIEALKSVPGIGEWTAQYIAMRALAWPDAFPHSDLAVIKALGEKSSKKLLAVGEKWRPWRAYAVMHLWSGASAARKEG